MSRLRALKDDERGVSLVEVVFAMALFFVIGSVFVFAMSTVSKVGDDSNEKANSVIAQSGLSNSFRNDMANAKAVKVPYSKSLLIAKNDGTCVSWMVANDPEGKKQAIGRSEANGSPAPAVTSFFQRELLSGDFSANVSSAKVNFIYYSGTTPQYFSLSAPLNVAGGDGGVCWS